MPLKSNLDEVLKRMGRKAERLPELVSNELVNFALDNWRAQAFLDKPQKKWPERGARSSSEAYKKRVAQDAGRALLVKSGDLRNSMTTGAYHGRWYAGIRTDVPYASAHNSGTDRLPQRQFLGPSLVLSERLVKLMIEQLDGTKTV